ncbi:hypothetical protein BBC0122_018980 [Bartonella choladocola]|uniref:TubC N-terminal docking domain-containing protein n=1 Tax=Bartonella choladocola TaxID=2750995 RepID=A0A1U9MJU4_9HYPH|nr:hypothetical protein BBC0122_018980 [Bartonella choladocola]
MKTANDIIDIIKNQTTVLQGMHVCWIDEDQTLYVKPPEIMSLNALHRELTETRQKRLYKAIKLSKNSFLRIIRYSMSKYVFH